MLADFLEFKKNAKDVCESEITELSKRKGSSSPVNNHQQLRELTAQRERISVDINCIVVSLQQIEQLEQDFLAVSKQASHMLSLLSMFEIVDEAFRILFDKKDEEATRMADALSSIIACDQLPLVENLIKAVFTGEKVRRPKEILKSLLHLLSPWGAENPEHISSRKGARNEIFYKGIKEDTLSLTYEITNKIAFLLRNIIRIGALCKPPEERVRKHPVGGAKLEELLNDIIGQMEATQDISYSSLAKQQRMVEDKELQVERMAKTLSLMAEQLKELGAHGQPNTANPRVVSRQASVTCPGLSDSSVAIFGSQRATLDAPEAAAAAAFP